MKFLKFAVAAVFALTFSNAYAFHSGGVAECEGCHSMHNSFDGSPNVTGRTFAQGTGVYLLKANDSSGACLNCHQAADTAPSSYHISTAGVNPYDSTSPVESTPGGDFAWLKKTMNVIIRKTTALDGNPGERHGHNVVAADFGYVADSTLTVAPGGTYPAANFSCISCHDPHGKYRRDATGAIATSGLPIWNSGSYNNSANPIAGVSAVGAYRILGGIGYQPKSRHGLLRLREHRSRRRRRLDLQPLRERRPDRHRLRAQHRRVVRQLPRLDAPERLHLRHGRPPPPGWQRCRSNGRRRRQLQLLGPHGRHDERHPRRRLLDPRPVPAADRRLRRGQGGRRHLERPRQPEHAGRRRREQRWPASPATAPTPPASRARCGSST